MSIINSKRWQELAGINECLLENTEQKKPDYLAYAVALSKKYGAISPGQVKYVADKKENVKDIDVTLYDIANIIYVSGLFKKEYNPAFKIPLYNLKSNILKEMKGNYVGEKEIWDYPNNKSATDKPDYLSDKDDEYSKIPKRIGMKKNSKILEEDMLETFNAFTGLLTSGILTVLIATKGKTIMKSIENVANLFFDYVDNLERNLSEDKFKEYIHVFNMTKKIINRLSNDPIFIKKLYELNKNLEYKSKNYMDPYTKETIIKSNKSLEDYLINKLTSEEKEYIKDIVKIMTNNI